jgi:hypothetical protein
MTLPAVYFSNQLFYVNGTPLSPFSTAEGTPSAAQSITVNGQGLTAGISVSAPSGFEVSTDDASYGPTAEIPQASGTVTGASLFIRVAASATAGSLSGNVTLTSTGSQSVEVPVGATVDPGAGYDSWATGYGLDPATDGAPTADPDGDTFTNEQEYAFGTIPTEGNDALLTTETSSGNLIVRWLQRSDVTYAAQSTANLAATPFADDPSIVIVDGPVDPAPPDGYTRKEFSVPAAGQAFYRVQATLGGG